ncbi:MAG: type I-C CRISPR-associated protein Cas8c/Csd1 [Elusimicrobia bacterium]|nr:type I-C CRISPR-associated protein Cas8c/Csd1 [Elusimicrobiota bacterium]
MILQALFNLAQNEGLMDDPDYEWKKVPWLVYVGKEGELSGIVGTHNVPPQEEGRKKMPKPVPKRFLLPREKALTSGARAFLLYGKSDYVFGIDPGGERSADQLKERFKLFRERVQECREATKDAAVQTVCKLLEDVATGRQKVSLPKDCGGSDLFAFIYSPDNNMLVTDREKVRAYWKNQRAQVLPKNTEDGNVRRCLVTGNLWLTKVDNFPSTKRVPGGTRSGVALVSFNKGAFESYGWEGNDNAPISREAAEACSTALTRLLDPAYPNPRDPGTVLPRRNLRLSDDTAVCYWSSRTGPEDFASFFGPLLEANPESVKELYHSIWKGQMPAKEDPSAFYALTLSGAQGRAIVRDWFESTVKQVQGNLARHFADLDIVHNAPRKEGSSHPPGLSLRTLLESLADPVRNRSEGIPAPLSTQFIKAGLSATPYPLAVLQRALLRFRAEIGKEQDQVQGWLVKNWNDARAALIKAVLNRRKRFSNETVPYKEVQREMDPNNANEGYVLGRLMAVLERLQREAIGDPNASVVDRYFSGASAAPKSVFVRLLKNARHHVRKAKDEPERAGFVFLLDKLVDELAERFDPKRNGFPAHLDMEQQGLFVLGYHQMRHWFWMNKEEREKWQSLYPDAPRAYLWGSRN